MSGTMNQGCATWEIRDLVFNKLRLRNKGKRPMRGRLEVHGALESRDIEPANTE